MHHNVDEYCCIFHIMLIMTNTLWFFCRCFPFHRCIFLLEMNWIIFSVVGVSYGWYVLSLHCPTFLHNAGVPFCKSLIQQKNRCSTFLYNAGMPYCKLSISRKMPTKCVILLQVEKLVDHIKFDHGYTTKSPPIVNVSIFSSYFLYGYLISFTWAIISLLTG